MRGELLPRIFDGIGDTTAVPLPGRWRVTNITSNWAGGFYSAAMRYDADAASLLRLVDWLGHRMEVRDRAGRLAWEGMLTEVEIHTLGYTFGYSIDDLVNAVQVLYNTISGQGEDAVGERAATTWATDADSIALYGRIERVRSISGATDAQAQAERDRYLGLYKRPLLSQRVGREAIDLPYAMVRARGYWWSCEWQIYNQSGVGDVATGTQIATIVSGECPLLASSSVVATGVSASQFRDANQSAWQEIKRLLSFGDSSGNPLTCQVWDGRVLSVAALPTAVAYRRLADGSVVDINGAIVDGWLVRAGRILRLAEMVPGAMEYSPALADPRNVLLQQVSYSEDAGLAFTPLLQRDLAGILLGQLEPWE